MTSVGRTPIHIDSVLNLYALLEEAVSKPQSFADDPLFIAALQSQGSLAKYTNSEKSIAPSSINTLKRISENRINGGFVALDAKRVAARTTISDYLSHSEKPKKSTNSGLRATIKQLELQLQTAHSSSWQLTKALNESLKDSRSYAASSGMPSIVERCKKDQQKLLQVFAQFSQSRLDQGGKDDS